MSQPNETQPNETRSNESATANARGGILTRFFKLDEAKTTARTEILAGLTTFLAVAYILAVNPSILADAGMNRNGVFVATALASFFGTAVMALAANYPFVLAPGMGLNAYFAYTIVVGMGYSWSFALFAVFLEGLIFVALTLTKAREAVFNAIPFALKLTVGAGIGLFIAFIALKNAKIVVFDSETFVKMGKITAETVHTTGACAILAFVGLLLTAVCQVRRVPGGILFGIVATWLLGILAQATGFYRVDPALGCYSLYPDFGANGLGGLASGVRETFGAALDADSWTKAGSETTGWGLLKSGEILAVVFALFFVDFFDTIGTLAGVAGKAGMLDKNGELPRVEKALMADAVATSVGAVFGTSTTTTFAESAVGVAQGGRTGLTAATAAILFLLAIPLAPIFLAIPGFATAPALIVVGFYMTSAVAQIDFDDLADALPAFVALIAIPFTGSIAQGVSLGTISWTLVNLATGRRRKVSSTMLALTAFLLATYFAFRQ